MDRDTARRIEVIAGELLAKANAVGRIPTPLGDVLLAAGLSEPSQSLLSPGQIEQAPGHIRGLIAKIMGKIRGLVDRRALEVHLDPSVTPEGRRRFIKAHEIIHHALPWQAELAYADDDMRLSPEVRFAFELEASRGAAELLYQGPKFAKEMADFSVGMAAVVEGSRRYQVSLESALWRYAESNRGPVLAVVLDPSPISRDPLRYKRRQLVQSQAFAKRFGSSIWPARLDVGRYSFLNEAAATSAAGVVVCGDWICKDPDGKDVKLRTECLATPHAILVLIWIPRKSIFRRKVKLVTQLIAGPEREFSGRLDAFQFSAQVSERKALRAEMVRLQPRDRIPLAATALDRSRSASNYVPPPSHVSRPDPHERVV